MNRAAHVYRHNRWEDDVPNPEHAAVVLSRGPWVLVYWDGGWHECGGGYNMVDPALADGAWITQGGTVELHERAA